MNRSNYEILLDKLDAFIRKYYKNLLLKGLIYFLSIALMTYLAVTTLEYFGKFNSSVRAFLFFMALTLTLIVLYGFVVRPLAGFFRIGKRIGHEEASRIIGAHFGEVKDKLLNTLQLKELSGSDRSSSELIEASIRQRVDELRPVPFVQAIDLRQNTRYLKYLAIPVLIFVVLLFTNARIMRESTMRLVRFNNEFVPEAPFRFQFLNESRQAEQNESVDLKLKTEGEEVPADAYVEVDGKRYKMLADGAGKFSFTLRNVQKDFTLRFWADRFYSEEYTFQVSARPLLTGFKVRLDYPAYTGKKDEALNNTGDLSIPEGTLVSWEFDTRNARDAWLSFGGNKEEMQRRSSTSYTYKKQLRESQAYFLALQKENNSGYDSVPYRINVIPDAYPSIQSEEKPDSLQPRMRFFVGEISDDYGFSSLRFVYRFVKSRVDSLRGKTFQTDMSFQPGISKQQFIHIWDLKTLNLAPGDQVEYYFEVYDNDGINGAKRAISKSTVYEVPTEKEIQEQLDKKGDEIKKNLEEAMKETQKLGKDLQKLQKKLLEKKELSWEDKQELDKLLQRQQELEKKIEELKQENKQNNQLQNEYTPLEEKLMQKQQELEKLFDELFSDELKQMLEELQQLMEEQNKEGVREELEKMQLEEKELDKQLERMLEMYKRFEVEKKLEQNQEKLEELGEEQEKLSEESKQTDSDPDELKQKQDSLNKAFEELQEEMQETDSLNKQLEEPMDMEMPEEEDMDDIGDDMKGGSEKLEEGDKKGASEKQKEAADKMKKLSKKMQEMMKTSEMEQHQEDYETLRGILENLVQLSFDQEALMEEFGEVNSYNPKFVEMVQRQKKIRDDSRIVEDSLLALSKRAVILRSYINAEMGRINHNLNKSMTELAKREVKEARVSQQFTMTHMNNLAVMLSEILKNMQDEMNAMGSGSGQKKSKPKPGDAKKMKEMEKELGEQLKKMKQGMQQGDSPGSRKWAEMAAKQEMIRRMLESLKKKMQEEGNGKEAGELQKTIEQMEKLEEDLVNKRLNLESMKRLQEIETRLLEHEKAERERDQDDQRESRQGKQKERPLPPELEEYLKQKEKESELLKSVPPELRPYYKQKIREYFRQLSQ